MLTQAPISRRRDTSGGKYSGGPQLPSSSGVRALSYCQIVGYVHDELIIECTPEGSLDAICEQMGRTPLWIPGIELRADGYECGFYQKQ